MKKISVLILYYSGLKQDDEDTLEGVKGIYEAVTRLGHPVQKIEVNTNNWTDAVKTPADVVFNLVEDDGWDLYVKVGRALEKLGRAQIGHDMKNFRYAIKKAWIKRTMKRLSISTPRFLIFNAQSTIALPRTMSYPVIVKPSEQHAGIGISQSSVVKNEEELIKQVQDVLAAFPGEVIVEEFIRGREVHVTVFGNDDSVDVLPLCEIGYSGKFTEGWNIYSYNAKWDKKSWEYNDARVHAPAQLSPELTKKIEALAIQAYNAMACRDIARLDVRIDGSGTPYVVDINMNPSLNYYDEEDATTASVYAKRWTYDQFIEKVLLASYDRVHGKISV